MELLALIFAVVAAGCFLWGTWPHPAHPTTTNWTNLGLLFFVAAFVTQAVIVAGWHWTIK